MINSTDKIIVEDTSAKATPINVSILIMLTKTHLKVFWTFQQLTYLNLFLFQIHLTTQGNYNFVSNAKL